MLTSLAVSCFGLYGVKRVNSSVEVIADSAVPVLLSVNEIRGNYLALIPALYARASSANKEEGFELEKKIDEGLQSLAKQLELSEQKVTRDDEKNAVKAIKFRLVNFTNRVRQLNKLVPEVDLEMAMVMFQRDVIPLHQSLAASFDELVKLNSDRVSIEALAADENYRQTLIITLAVAMVGVTVIGTMGFFFGRAIAIPLSRMQQAITHTSSSLDFTESVPVENEDEIGTTLQAYNGLMEKLRNSIGGVQKTAARMAEVSDEVKKASHEIAKNSHAQNDASSEMAASIEQLTVSISMVANQAQDASQHTQKSNDTADHGGEIVLSTINAILTISDSVREASSRIEALRDDNAKISSVANIIKEIAEQTNLLALNAAIEAARAGEQGRGFAVVADEVRKLAERTARSTQEISSLLGQMQGSANLAVESMTAAVREVEAGVTSAQLAGKSIHDIKEGSGTVVGAVEDITEAVREQSSATTLISQRVEQIAQMAEQNTVAVESTVGAVDQISEMSEMIALALKVYKVS